MDVIVDGELQELLITGNSKTYRDVARNHVLMKGYRRAVATMQAVMNPEELHSFSSLHYEQLKHEYSGYSSVRLSNSYVHRLIFKEYDDCITLELIDIDDTHYGNKK